MNDPAPEQPTTTDWTPPSPPEPPPAQGDPDALLHATHDADERADAHGDNEIPAEGGEPAEPG